MFDNIIKDDYRYGYDCAFDYNGTSCQLCHFKGGNTSINELYFGNKYIQWGQLNGEEFHKGNDFVLVEYKEFLEEFVKFFGYAFPTV
nr:MAG TPA: Diheme cytochrome c peroxidase [Caudoviricetes sp.]